MGIPFNEFESVIAKICHAFMAIPAGKGLLTPCNNILQMKLSVVFLQHNHILLAAVKGCRTLLRESSDSPTRCRELVSGWPPIILVCATPPHMESVGSSLVKTKPVSPRSSDGNGHKPSKHNILKRRSPTPISKWLDFYSYGS